jgi:hypothetical protein
VVGRLAARIAKLEARMPPPTVGCDACRGRTVFGLGQFETAERGGRAVNVCAACGREPAEWTNFIAVNLGDVV